jgi:hypothetical protein
VAARPAARCHGSGRPLSWPGAPSDAARSDTVMPGHHSEASPQFKFAAGFRVAASESPLAAAGAGRRAGPGLPASPGSAVRHTVRVRQVTSRSRLVSAGPSESLRPGRPESQHWGESNSSSPPASQWSGAGESLRPGRPESQHWPASRPSPPPPAGPGWGRGPSVAFKFATRRARASDRTAWQCHHRAMITPSNSARARPGPTGPAAPAAAAGGRWAARVGVILF